MEFPRAVLVGKNVIKELGTFIQRFDKSVGKILVVSGKNVTKSIGKGVIDTLDKNGISYNWITVDSPTMECLEIVEEEGKTGYKMVIGIGGGKCIDIAKAASYNLNITFISVPTSASHDGIASPFASIKGGAKPYSLVARPPIGILADIDIISHAPSEFLMSGCGDLVAKVTAYKDWILARDEKGEYFGEYSANLARMSSNIILKGTSLEFISPSLDKELNQNKYERVTSVIEALISSGVAAGIAGSSRPCSGSEHLFSHALDILYPGIGLHGQKCGIGTIMMAKLHGINYEEIRTSLLNIGAPTTAKEIGLSEEAIIESLLLAPKLRPERYTIIHKINLDAESALELAKSCQII